MITCKNAHMWRVSFVPRTITGGTIRQVKYWCARCERSERDARKAFHRERDADRMRELSEMQARLIKQAEMCGANEAGCRSETDEMDEEEEEDIEGDKRGMNNNTRNNTRTRDKRINNSDKPEEEDEIIDEEEKATPITNTDINAFMRAIANPRTTVRAMEALTTEQFMHQIVELIIRATEQRMVNFFAALPKAQRTRMFRRLSLFVHPDKNQAHTQANEAF